jgi:hydrogenase maturation protease
MGDEGVGPRTVEELLSRFRFPDSVEVLDAGTMGFTMLNIFDGIDFAIIVDAIDSTGHEPGTVLLLDPGSLAPNQIMHSLHDARLPDVLDAARLIGLEPEVTCIAVQVGRIAQWELELTEAVEAAVPRAAEAVVGILLERGIQVRTVGCQADDACDTSDGGNKEAMADAAPDEPATAARTSEGDEAGRAVKILRSVRTRDDVSG